MQVYKSVVNGKKAVREFNYLIATTSNGKKVREVHFVGKLTHEVKKKILTKYAKFRQNMIFIALKLLYNI
jgi:hypothetical protein